jgi:hypothetical protein
MNNIVLLGEYVTKLVLFSQIGPEILHALDRRFISHSHPTLAKLLSIITSLRTSIFLPRWTLLCSAACSQVKGSKNFEHVPITVAKYLVRFALSGELTKQRSTTLLIRTYLRQRKTLNRTRTAGPEQSNKERREHRRFSRAAEPYSTPLVPMNTISMGGHWG